MLVAEGYRASAATDGEEGLHRVNDERPDLVLRNVQVPMLSGTDMAKAIRSDATLDGMPILLMSGGAASRSDAPYDGFLEKPFHTDTPVATVSRLLNYADSRQSTREASDAPVPEDSPEPKRQQLIRAIQVIEEQIGVLHEEGKALHQQFRDAAQRHDLQAMRVFAHKHAAIAGQIPGLTAQVTGLRRQLGGRR